MFHPNAPVVLKKSLTLNKNLPILSILCDEIYDNPNVSLKWLYLMTQKRCCSPNTSGGAEFQNDVLSGKCLFSM